MSFIIKRNDSICTTFLKEVRGSPGRTLSDKFLLADRSHLHSLKLVSSRPGDSGKYICVVFRRGDNLTTNLQNCNVARHVSDTVLAHQAAHVSVLPNYRETSPPAKNYRNSRSSSSSSSFTSLSSLTIVLAVLGSIVLVLVSILIVLLCRTSGSNKSDDKNAKIIFV